MASRTDIEIVSLLRSDKPRDQNIGAKYLISEFREKSMAYLRSTFQGASFEDIWQEAAADMIVQIQNKKYEPYPEVEMYTFFRHILKSTALREHRKFKKVDFKEDLSQYENRASEHFDIEKGLELIEFRAAFKACVAKQRSPYSTILNNIYVKDIRLKDFFRDLGITTYNNAKVKHHKAKKKLLNCLRIRLKDNGTT